MQKNIDENRIRDAVKEIISALGDDPGREGLKETPTRVAKMYTELFEGMLYTNDEIAKMNNKCFYENVSDNLVIVKDIECFSFCEHHMALMYNMKIHVGYIPHKKIIGLSKIARVCDMVCKRLQLQERIGEDISDILIKILDTQDIAVVIESSHSCMTVRGIKKPNALTHTCTLKGRFLIEGDLRTEFYTNLKS